MTIRELPSSLYYNKLPTLRDFLPRVSFNSIHLEKKSVERFDWCQNDAPIKSSFRIVRKFSHLFEIASSIEESFSLY